jgi:hypothetical protein
MPFTGRARLVGAKGEEVSRIVEEHLLYLRNRGVVPHPGSVMLDIYLRSGGGAFQNVLKCCEGLVFGVVSIRGLERSHRERLTVLFDLDVDPPKQIESACVKL